MGVETDLKNFIRLEVLMAQVSVTLRRVFRDRWENTSGCVWVNSSTCGHEFITTIGRDIFKNADHLQRKNLENGDVNTWDMLTLSQIFLQVDFQKEDTQNVAKEKSYLGQLLEVQTKMSHDPTKTKIKKELLHLSRKVAKILAHFGYSDEKLKELLVAENIGGIDFGPAPFLNSVQVQEANRLKERGNKDFKDGHLDEAVERYTEAIDLSDISDEVLAILYYNRAAVYIKKAENTKLTENGKTKALQDALENVAKAVSVRPNWWKAHFRLGKVYELMGKLNDAVLAFDCAVLLNPEDNGVKITRDNCRSYLTKIEIRKYLDPFSLSTIIEDQIEKIIENEGFEVLNSRWVAKQKHVPNESDPRATVLKAHRLRHGLDETRCYEMAAKLYEKAATKENAEGLYHLALMTKNGLGVKRDIERYIRLLKRAASQRINKDGLPNIGVAEAEFEIAIIYMEPSALLNIEVAITWLERSFEHGHGSAAHVLGCIYEGGHYVKRDYKRALEYWKMAALRKVSGTHAMESLYDFFLEEKNPAQAKKWFLQALKTGSVKAEVDRENFERNLGLISTKVDYFHFTMWEQVNGFDSGELSFSDRFLRMMSAYRDTVSDYFFDNVVSHLDRIENSMNPVSEKRHHFDLEELAVLAEKGSKTAKNLHAALKHHRQGIALLKNGGHECQAVHHTAECFRIAPVVEEWSWPVQKLCGVFIEKQLRVIAKSDISSLDRDLQICHAHLERTRRNLRETIAILDKAIAKYPDETCLYLLRVQILKSLKDDQEGLRKCLEALDLFPDHVALLLEKAKLLKFVNIPGSKETVVAYEDYLRVAEKDDLFVPDAHYEIAFQCYMAHQRDSGRDSSKEKTMMIKRYVLGLESEKLQLPCFLPYKSDKKESLVTIMENIRCLARVPRFPESYTIANASENVASPSTPAAREETTSSIEPLRLQIIRSHRTIMSNIDGNEVVCRILEKPKKKQTQVSRQKAITLRDMDPSKNRVYKGSVLRLTSIEDAILGSSFIRLVVEDENNEVQRCHVDNFTRDMQEVQRNLGFGCQFSFVNPDMRMMKDGKPVLRVVSPKSLMFHSGRDFKRCRFCGKGDSSLKCSMCRKAFYCSKECQTQDWKLLKHKLICAKMP